jgi:energy-coupling factor transporter ATP-binding protein EcfA2
MIKLQRLLITRYRNVLPGTELRLDGQVNLVLGEPGAGKTMLLGLLAAIAGSDFSRLEAEPFDLAYDVSDGVFAATVVIRGDGLPPRSPTDGLPEPTSYAYRISVHRVGGEPVCEFTGTPEALLVRVSGAAEPRRLPPSAPFRRGFLTQALRQPPAAALFFGAWRLFNWHGTAARFDESLDCFLAMTGRPPALRGAALPQLAEAVFSFDPKSALRTSTLYSVAHYLPGGAIDRAIVDAHRSAAGETRLDGDHESAPSAALTSLEFLRRAAAILGFRSASFQPDVSSYRSERSTGELHYAVRGFTFRFTRSDGTTLHHDALSYGQKRLLAFFYYLAASEEFVFADDLAHGLPDAWISDCVQAMGARQAFITGLDPRVLAHLGFDSPARVQARVITCEVVRDADGAEQLQWRTISPDAATEFFQRHVRETTGLTPPPAAVDPPAV